MRSPSPEHSSRQEQVLQQETKNFVSGEEKVYGPYQLGSGDDLTVKATGSDRFYIVALDVPTFQRLKGRGIGGTFPFRAGSDQASAEFTRHIRFAGEYCVVVRLGRFTRPTVIEMDIRRIVARSASPTLNVAGPVDIASSIDVEARGTRSVEPTGESETSSSPLGNIANVLPIVQLVLAVIFVIFGVALTLDFYVLARYGLAEFDATLSAEGSFLGAGAGVGAIAALYVAYRTYNPRTHGSKSKRTK